MLVLNGAMTLSVKKSIFVEIKTVFFKHHLTQNHSTPFSHWKEKMMKRFTIVTSLAIVLLACNAFAQLRALEIGGGMALPMGSFGDLAGTGFGASGRAFYEREGLDNIMFTGSVGFYPFGGKEYTLFGLSSGYEWSWTVIPIMSGGRYYFGEAEAKTRMYVGAEIGIHIYSVSLQDNDGNTIDGAVAAGSTEFALLPMVGAELGPLDVYAEYSLSEFNYFGIKGMFKFSLGKK